MRGKVILLVSLVLNVALAVALVTWLSSASNPGQRMVRSPMVPPASSNIYRIVKTNVLVRPRAFTWQEVESPDYEIYVENLRTLGMPDSTVRDIIVADIDQLFAKRKREEAAMHDMEWWLSSPSFETQSNALVRSQALEADRAALLAKLLGPDWDKGRADREPVPLALVGPVLGNLPDDIKASVQNLAAKSMERVRDYVAKKQAAGENFDPVELARLREDTRRQLAGILSPLQLEEFLLRYSDTASRLRQELTGFNASPEEFRSLFRSIDAIDREIQLRYSGNDPASQRARQNLEEQRALAVRNALGPERFADYQMVRDPAYRDAVNVARQAGGDEDTALSLYQIGRATVDELDRIRNDPSLTDAEKGRQMREAERQQQLARAILLGDTPATEPAATVPEPPPLQRHVVERGETLAVIALRFGVPVGELREANPGLDISRPAAGAVLNIPPPSFEPVPLIPRPGAR